MPTTADRDDMTLVQLLRNAARRHAQLAGHLFRDEAITVAQEAESLYSRADYLEGLLREHSVLHEGTVRLATLRLALDPPGVPAQQLTRGEQAEVAADLRSRGLLSADAAAKVMWQPEAGADVPVCRVGCGDENPGADECVFKRDDGRCACFSENGRTFCSPACRDAGRPLNPAPAGGTR